MQQIVQIVPYRDARSGGIEDYALILAAGLLSQASRKTAFLSCRHISTSPPKDNFETIYLKTRSNFDFDIAFRENFPQCREVILHYSGYGLDRYGAPSWIGRALKTLKDNRNIKITTIFHELDVRPTLFSKHQLLRPRQIHAIKRIAKVSDTILTTTDIYQERLGRWTHKEVQRIPVNSTIGEPKKIISKTKTALSACIFANDQMAQKTYNTNTLPVFLKANKVKNLEDIGTRTFVVPSYELFCKTQRHGRIATPEISKILLNCHFGIISTPTTYTQKSTILSAYLAHGVVPVFIRDSNVTPLKVQQTDTFKFFEFNTIPSHEQISEYAQSNHIYYHNNRSTQLTLSTIVNSFSS